VVGRADQAGLEPPDSGQEQRARPGPRRRRAVRLEAPRWGIEPLATASPGIDSEPVLICCAGAQTGDALGDGEVLALLGAGEVALAADLPPLSSVRPTQLPPEVAVGASVLAGLAVLAGVAVLVGATRVRRKASLAPDEGVLIGAVMLAGAPVLARTVRIGATLLALAALLAGAAVHIGPEGGGVGGDVRGTLDLDGATAG
jgi:hypothetical protein